MMKKVSLLVMQTINKISLVLQSLALCHPWPRSSCFAKQNLELLDPRIHGHRIIFGSSGQEKSLFSKGKQAFSSPRMTTWWRRSVFYKIGWSFIYLSLLTGCSLFEGTEPLPFFTLKSEMSRSTHNLDFPIAIEMPISEESLNTQRIAVTPSAYQRDYLADGQWPDRLPKILQGALLTSLGQRWGATQLSRVSDGLLTAYILRLDIQDFSVHPLDKGRAEVHMKILFKVVNFNARRILAARTFSQKTSVSSYTMIGIVEAFNKGFHDLVEQASPWMEETFLKESSLNSRNDKLSRKGR